MNARRRTSHGPAADRFHSALRPLLLPDADPLLFPSALAEAARVALTADGVGLSVFADQRVPIGSSDGTAIAAEQLQFTTGEGPCLEALARQRVSRVDADQMAEEWPTFYESLVRQTPYRSVVAVPFALHSGLTAALDLFLTGSQMPPYSIVRDAEVVTRCVTDLLDSADPGGSSGRTEVGDLPAWVYGTQARQRLRVWIAVGIIVAAADLNPADALSRLRAAAFARSEEVDDLAAALTEGSVRPEELDR